MKIKLSTLKFGFAFTLFIMGFIELKADSTSTNFGYDLRLSSSFNGLQKHPTLDSNVQYSFQIQNVFYYRIKHIGVGIGTGMSNAMYYISEQKAYNRVYQAPIFFSVKLLSTDQKIHLFQNFGMAVPIKSSLQNINTGYYFQTGIGLGSKQIKFELTYKIITLVRDRGPMINKNISFGLSYNLK
jgi:hypothetical protein